MVDKIFIALVIFFIVGCLMGFSLNDCLGRDVPQPDEKPSTEESGFIGLSWIATVWAGLTRNLNKVKRPSIKIRLLIINARGLIRSTKTYKFLTSLMAFIRLYRAGFKITYDTTNVIDWDLYRFWWGEKVIARFPDIDRSGHHWCTVHNGLSVPLRDRFVGMSGEEYNEHLRALSMVADHLRLSEESKENKVKNG